jgi:hypothetical protein
VATICEMFSMERMPSFVMVRRSLGIFLLMVKSTGEKIKTKSANRCKTKVVGETKLKLILVNDQLDPQIRTRQRRSSPLERFNC